MVLSLVVLCRIVANPLSNVFQKKLTQRTADPLFVILATHALLSVVCLPAAVYLAPQLPFDFWWNIGVVAVLTVAGNALIVLAVKRSDLSVLGPVNAYKSIVSLVPAMILLREFPGWMGIGGMALIVAGSYFIVDKRAAAPRQNVFVRFFTDRGVQYRFAAMAVSAVEAVFLKRAMLASSPVAAFAFWAVLGFAVSLAAAPLVIGNRLAAEWRTAAADGRTYVWLALSTGLMQFCTIVAFAGFQVGYALALFQTSAVLSVLLGYKLLDERNVVERLIGSVVMAAGAVLIVLGR